MADKQDWTPEQIIDALKKSNGYISQAAQILGCTFQTVCNYRDRYPQVKEVLVAMQERELDFTESKLMENIRAGKEASVFFKLKTQGKHRGFIERSEIEHSGMVRIDSVLDAMSEEQRREFIRRLAEQSGSKTD